MGFAHSATRALVTSGTYDGREGCAVSIPVHLKGLGKTMSSWSSLRARVIIADRFGFLTQWREIVMLQYTQTSYTTLCFQPCANSSEKGHIWDFTGALVRCPLTVVHRECISVDSCLSMKPILRTIDFDLFLLQSWSTKKHTEVHWACSALLYTT